MGETLNELYASILEDYLKRNMYDLGDAMKNALAGAIECLRKHPDN